MATYIHSAAAVHAGPGLIAEDLVEAVKQVMADFDADYRNRHGTAGRGTRRTNGK